MQTEDSIPVFNIKKPRKTYAGYIIFVLVIAIMIGTNPSKQKHITAISAQYYKMKLSQPLSQIPADSLNKLTTEQLDKAIMLKIGNDYKNFYLFSLIRNQDSVNLTVGVFGNVFLDERVFEYSYY